MAVNVVQKMYLEALSRRKKLSKRNYLEEIYRELNDRGEIDFIGPPLKCPRQMGLPDFLLRRSNDDLEHLASVMKNSCIKFCDQGDLQRFHINLRDDNYLNHSHLPSTA